jgi:WD40 repeat protein
MSRGLAFSANGDRFVTLGGQASFTDLPMEVKVWETATGRELVTVRGDTRHLRSAAFAPDGRRLALGNERGIVRMYHVTGSAEARDLVRPVKVTTPAGNSLEITDQFVQIYTLARVGITASRDKQAKQVRQVTFSPDGKRLVVNTGLGDAFQVFDVASGESPLFFLGANATFTSDSQSIAAIGKLAEVENRVHIGQNTKAIEIWDVTTGKRAFMYHGHQGEINSIALSPDGRRMASADTAQMIKVRDTQARRELYSKHGLSSPNQILGFSLDGCRLISAAMARGSGSGVEWKVWDVVTGQKLFLLHNVDGRHPGFSFSPDGRWLAAPLYRDRETKALITKIWDATTGQEIRTLTGRDFPGAGRAYAGQYDQLSGVVFSPDGRFLASFWGNGIMIWDAHTGQERAALLGHHDSVATMAFSPDGGRLASGGYDHAVRIWDVMSGLELLTLRGHSDVVQSLAFSPDGHLLVSGSKDGTVKIWDGTPLENNR